MDLDWLVFPSPDSSYSLDRCHGELIFIPKENNSQFEQEQDENNIEKNLNNFNGIINVNESNFKENLQNNNQVSNNANNVNNELVKISINNNKNNNIENSPNIHFKNNK